MPISKEGVRKVNLQTIKNAERFIVFNEAVQKEALENGRNALFGLNGTEVDYIVAMECFNVVRYDAMDELEAELLYYQGRMYDCGYGVIKDYRKAYDCLSDAAYEGNAKAEYALGYLYYGGNHVEQDKAKAKECFEKAVKNGCVEAKEGLAHIAYYDDTDYETATFRISD